MKNFNIENILSLHNWNNKFLSFKTTKFYNYKFKNGEFVIIGLKKLNEFISRPYSILSSNTSKYFEFLSIKIQNGLFTNLLKNLKINENIYISKKSFGTLNSNKLKNNFKRLWIISTGTGISPFISIINDLKIYKYFYKIIIIHTVDLKIDLIYRYYINNIFYKNFIYFFKCIVKYYPTITKENFINKGRVVRMIRNGSLFFNLNINYINKNNDIFMICGNINMINDLVKKLRILKFEKSNCGKLNNIILENAFINKIKDNL